MFYVLVAPVLSLSVSSRTVNETQNVKFSCIVVAANPSANVTLRGPLNRTIDSTQGVAILSTVGRSDSGTYICIAENGLIGSPVIDTVSLTVQCKSLRCYYYKLVSM